jgi:choline monooxygenase
MLVEPMPQPTLVAREHYQSGCFPINPQRGPEGPSGGPGKGIGWAAMPPRRGSSRAADAAAGGPRIDPEIGRAETLPGRWYADPEVHARVRERVFARSWHLVARESEVRVPGQVLPAWLGGGILDEPILLTRDREDRLHCLSNVCTHRGALVCEGPGVESVLRCRYHGRRFGLDGSFLSMPEFEGVEGFPSSADDLPRLELASWRGLLFAALEPAFPFADLVAPLDERIGHLPFGSAQLDPAGSREYLVRANWALYCDNYLEGFHVPYVHAGLAAAIDYGSYRTELFRWSSLQVGVAAGGEETFDLPADHPDAGRGEERIAAFWFWLFPNLMLNVYPWGLSINVVEPLTVDRTRVRYSRLVWDASRIETSAGAALDRVEREDEAVVESVQLGVSSRLYHRGRYSPARETGVHHFHHLLAGLLDGG